MDGLKLVSFVLGDWPELRRLTGELEGLLRDDRDRWYRQWVLAESAFAWAAAGDWETAVARLDQAQALNTTLGDRFTMPYLLTMRAWLERTRGRYPDAIALGRDAATAAADGRDIHGIAWSETNLGAILAEAAGPDQAIAHLEAGRAAALEGGIRIQAVRAAAHLARARLDAGDAAAAERERIAAEAILDSVQCPAGKHFLHGLDAYLAVAEVRMTLGDLDGAGARIAPLRAGAEAVGWHEGVARTCLLLARMTAAAGRAGEAADLARHALEAAASGGLPTVAAACERLLDGGGHQ